MEIDVTPDENPDTNPFTLCHVEEEKNPNAIVDSVVGTSNVSNSCSLDELDPLATIGGKKTIKHALRQQARRKRKDIVEPSTSVPRIIVKPLPPETPEEATREQNLVPQVSTKTPTMKEVLASIPGFNIKPRKRSNKKLSTAAQLEQTKAGCIDLETPDSILVNTNLRLLLNKATFASLPILYQNKLAQLLPLVDRQLVNNSSDPHCIEISSGLNNEFFARACLEWQDRLAEGEFTPENQQKLKLDADKERSKLDPWKLKHFEPIWGDRSFSSEGGSCSTDSSMGSTSRPPIKTTIKLRHSTTSATTKSKAPPPPPVKRIRTVGAMTRSCTTLKEETNKPSENKSPIPDLLPIRQVKNKLDYIKVQTDDIHHKAEEIFIPEPIKEDREETKGPIPGDISTVEIHDSCIVNISDAILDTNQETIIICREESEKRPRSSSSDRYENSPKRSKSMSPLELSPEPLDNFHNSDLKDPLDLTSEVASDDEKISENTSESVDQADDLFEKNRLIDENSSSSCSMAAHNLEEISSTEAIETVDSLQLHINYTEEDIEELGHVDEASSTASTTSTNTNTDEKSEQGSEMTQEQDETMTSIPDISENIPCEPETSCSQDQETNVLFNNEENQPAFYECPKENEEPAPETGMEIVEPQEEADENHLNSKTINNVVLSHMHNNEFQAIISQSVETQSAEANIVTSEPFIIEAVRDNTNEHVLEDSLPLPYEHSHESSSESNQKIEQGIVETFQMLPNTLIIQEESSGVLDKPEEYSVDSIAAVDAEKLEASVEEADLVSFDDAKIIQDDDDGEDRFIDAENYVLESGQITVSTTDKHVDKPEHDHIQNTIQTSLFGSGVATVAEECCWGLVDSSTENLLQVSALHGIETAVSGVSGVKGDISATENVQVIPMKEELEVRLEQGSFPVHNDWPYDVKMDPERGVGVTLGQAQQNDEPSGDTKESINYQTPDYNQGGKQVKLELEVTLTPEIINSDTLITSTVTSNNDNGSPSGGGATKPVANVIPPTTIVCLPSAVNAPSMQVPTVNEAVQCGAAVVPRPGLVQSSSSLPYLALSTSQPIRAVPTHSKSKPKNNNNNIGNRSRTNNNKPPPGAVNLERSYQICQAVIQNSPNRDQLKCQLKPPPSLLAAAAVNNTKKVDNRQTQYSSVTSSRGNKTFTPPLPATGNFQPASSRFNNGMKTLGPKVRPNMPFQQRQASPPVVVRHVFTTSGQGIPVTMAVLPQGSALSPEIVEGQNSQVGTVSQYIVVQRTGMVDQHNVPRSSSAPPAQQPALGNTISTVGMSQMIPGRGRGRPASVESDHPGLHQAAQPNDFVVQCPNPGTQAVTRRPRLPPGVVYGDVSIENQINNYTIIGENVIADHPATVMQQQKHDTCACSLKAMVVCKKCGAFCHDDCIGPNKLCRTCFIR
ncbi:polycomb protein Asx isoform X3 [Anthonomus grandis grandis]|uniref:polycomb protein Asx isoform X3 n=1 Tax=Anthonomus grandis grandis TaxID=2921223 RepID=UPI0021650BE1|nr:polycomb protein Asx isoform X3 [Anthonomus grandis grandis]